MRSILPPVAFAFALTLQVQALPDGRVTLLNPEAFRAVKALVGSDWGSRQALALSGVLWKDGQLDAAESDLLDELTQETKEPVVVSGATAEEPLNCPRASDLALVVFQWAQLPSQVRSRGWSEDWKPFLDFAGESQQKEAQIVAFLTLDLHKSYLTSNFANSYAPFRQRLSQMEERAKTLPTGRREAAIALTYKAAEQLDRLLLDQVQDFLYKYLQPKS